MTQATYITSTIAKSLIIVCMMIGFMTHVAVASEITGTLSSDGSAGDRSNTAEIMNTTNRDSLSGRVVSGVNSSQTNYATVSAILWTISLALLLTLGASFFYWRRST